MCVMRQLVECVYCNKEFSKDLKSIKRTEKYKTAHICSKICSGRYGASKRYVNSRGFGFYHRTAMTGARLKNLEYNLDPKYIESVFIRQKGLCILSNIPMTMNHHKLTKDKKSPYYASIDRIDNSKGYIRGNIQFVCLGINYLRNTFSLDITKKFLTDIKSQFESAM